ncbi:hypothetical protein MFUM_680001 [Methylacidiphilum fumariolicum SolV]|uniref:Uncharacterized protein n=1 Tax=Methylacidiphilum fumariolicum (strain SolV) TaxID=1156937 RepID=I0JYL5_METFB|nr:hypothetical protein MFUM_680001 [Methylacidiphilum fumariolicum SolV]
MPGLWHSGDTVRNMVVYTTPLRSLTMDAQVPGSGNPGGV